MGGIEPMSGRVVMVPLPKAMQGGQVKLTWLREEFSMVLVTNK